MPTLQSPDDDDSLDDWESQDDSIDDDTDSCPHCAKPVYVDAVRCPHCKNYINDEESNLNAPHHPQAANWVLFTAIFLIIVLLFGWAFFR